MFLQNKTKLETIQVQSLWSTCFVSTWIHADFVTALCKLYTYHYFNCECKLKLFADHNVGKTKVLDSFCYAVKG